MQLDCHCVRCDQANSPQEDYWARTGRFWNQVKVWIRLNKTPPNIDLKKKEKGGITLSKMVDCDLELDLVRNILHEYRISNADVTLRCDATIDDIIDVIEGNRKYIPCLYALNKIDDITIEELDILDAIPHYVPVCAELEWNLDELVERCWEYLDLIR